MTPSERLREIENLGGDEITLFLQTDDLQRRCREGLQQQKVSAKDGVLDTIERYPETELRCIAFKKKLADDLKKEVAGSVTDTHVTVEIRRAVPAEFADG